MLKFDLMEKYLEEQENAKEARQKFLDRESKAIENYVATKHKYESTLAASIREGKDLSEELDALDQAVQDAKTIYTRRKQEAEASGRFRTGTIKPIDIVNAFNKEYKGKVQEDILPSIYERVELGRNLILSAMLDYNKAKSDYQGITYQIKELADAAKQNGETPYYMGVENPILKNYDFDGRSDFVNQVLGMQSDVYDVEKNLRLPDNAEYIENVKGEKK
jgi:ribosomal protein L22